LRLPTSGQWLRPCPLPLTAPPLMVLVEHLKESIGLFSTNQVKNSVIENFLCELM
jgi:hypothetical protein